MLNRSFVVEGRPIAPRRFVEFRLLPGARESVRLLKQHGFKVIVVTNQPDIGRGTTEPAEVERMNRRLVDELAVDAVKVCPHAQDGDCGCRKPAPGMLREAAAEFGLSLGASYMVGDRWSDVVAGAAAGCYTIKIERGYSNEKPSQPDAVVGSLAAAVRHIISMENANGRP